MLDSLRLRGIVIGGFPIKINGRRANVVCGFVVFCGTPRLSLRLGEMVRSMRE